MRVAMLLHKSVVHDSRVRREAAALAADGHDVVVLELAAVDGTWLDGFRRVSVQASTRAGAIVRFVDALVRERPDVIHAHDAAMLLPGVVGRRLTGARLVYDSHELATSVPYRERTWAAFVSAVERLCLPRCAAVITVSDGIAARLRSRYALRVPPVVLRNVSSLARGGGVGGLRAAMGVGPDVALVLHQGAPAPSRGCDTLVRAVAQMPGVRLAFLGHADAGYDATLRELIAELGVAERVRLLPSVALEALLDHTAEADVGVTLLQDTCENHRLALPNKLFEYIAAGVPVVGADMPEVRALLSLHRVGWVAASDDPESVTGALRVALEARGDVAMTERLRAAHAQLRWDVERERLLELYRALEAA